MIDKGSCSSTRVCDSFEYQLNAFEQFCFKEAELSEFLKEDIRQKYKSLWNDFVSIKVKLIDGKLYNLFKNILNMNIDKINEFYNECLIYKRTLCVMLPTRSRRWNNEWCSTSTSTSNSNSNSRISNDVGDHIYRFIIVWNGIYEILFKTRRNVEVIEFPWKVGGLIENHMKTKSKKDELETKTEDSNVNSNDSDNYDNDELISKLSLLITEYFRDELVKTTIFGDYTLWDRDDEDYVGHPSNRAAVDKNNKETTDLFKQILFDDIHYNEFNKLLRYCISQHISNFNSYTDSEYTQRYLVQYVVNELAYVIFHDLTFDLLSNSKNHNYNKNEILLYPKLLNMFKFLYNFSCYIYCYPFSKRNQSFYISQYFDLKNALYQNIFDSQEYTKICEKAGKLNYYNYYCHRSSGDGTLLHKACEQDYRPYCQILIQDGFDVNLPSRKLIGRGITPYQVAQDHKQLLALLGSIADIDINNTEENKNDDDKESEELSVVTSSMQSIQDLCDLLLTQIMFSKYFLLCLGIKNINDDFNVKSEKEKLEYFLKHVRDYMSDELYVKLDQLERGLSVIDNKTRINGTDTMDSILSVVMKLIDTKMVISDDLIILSWIFCNSNSDTSGDNKHELFLNDLLNCVTDCLSGKSEYKTRNYMYFKQFLLHSNIWYCKDSKNNKLLFDYVDDLVDKLLTEQKKYIRDSIEKEEKEDSENWNKLLEFNTYNKNNIQFRQDRITNGIKSLKSVKNAFVTAAKISNPEYNVLAEFNDKIYLTQCIAFANENNEYFQSEIKALFRKSPNFNGSITGAPVKSYDRCLVKSSLVA